MGRTRKSESARKKGEDGLTDQQRDFVHYYMICDGNASEAARRAGYADNRGVAHDVLHKPAVQAAVRAQGDMVLQRELRTKKARLRSLASIFLDEGEKTADRLKAADMIMRATGDYLEKGIMLHVDVEKEQVVGSNGWLRPTASEAQQTVQELLKLNVGPPLLEKSG